VCRYCASETRDLPEEKQRWFWVASWPLPDGRRKRVKFSVKKYGEDGAFQMAMDARASALGKLVGAFDPGAVRRKASRRRPAAAAGAVGRLMRPQGGQSLSDRARLTIQVSRL
jgi:hypothetical protein